MITIVSQNPHSGFVMFGDGGMSDAKLNFISVLIDGHNYVAKSSLRFCNFW
jgi:hypothetical protein